MLRRTFTENERPLPVDTRELAILLTYLALGPFAWGFYLFVMHLGRKRMDLMKRSPEGGPLNDVPGDKPTVSILIPAKDEGERIRSCILSAIKQNYPKVEVIA